MFVRHFSLFRVGARGHGVDMQKWRQKPIWALFGTFCQISRTKKAINMGGPSRGVFGAEKPFPKVSAPLGHGNRVFSPKKRQNRHFDRQNRVFLGSQKASSKFF